MRGFDGEIMPPIIRKNKPQINADERRFVKSVADFHNYFVSSYALRAACPHASRQGEERRGGMENHN